VARRWDDVPTEPMFDMAHVQQPQRPRSLKSVTFGHCPECSAHDRVGLVWQGVHLVWRQHTYRTWSGATMICRTSNVSVCVAPERVPLTGIPVVCPHPTTSSGTTSDQFGAMMTASNPVPPDDTAA
jgi:hypothetical protein